MVREKSGKNNFFFKVTEKSGKFEIGQGNLEIQNKSGKSQGILQSRNVDQRKFMAVSSILAIFQLF